MTNLRVFRGDDGIITLKFLKGEANLDITDWKIFFTMKKNIEDNDDDAYYKRLTTIHTNPTAGETEIKWSDVESDEWEPGVYHFDIQYKADAAYDFEIKTVLRGTITVLADVTRRIA